MEISGEEATGKTTLALHCVKACQQNDGIAAFIDSEFALDPLYAARIGVDLDSLIFVQPKTAEQGFDMTFSLINTANVNLVVIDSLASLLPERQANTSTTKNSSLDYFLALSEGLCKLRSLLAFKKGLCTIVFTNQLRRIRLKPFEADLHSLDSVGGQSVSKFMTTKVRLSQGSGILDAQGGQYGHHCEMEIIKQKNTSCRCRASTPIIYNQGFASSYETLKVAMKSGLATKTQLGILVLNHNLGLNLIQAKRFLDKNPSLRFLIHREIVKRS